jgi:hypothetical protein
MVDSNKWQVKNQTKRLRGGGPLADLLERRFQRALREQGLTQKLPEMRRDRFVAPQLPGSQLSLF